MMLSEISDDAVPGDERSALLCEAQDLRIRLAAERLREAQALAGAFAAMLEGRAATVDDLLNMDALFTAACHRTGEALHTMGASLGCQGVA